MPASAQRPILQRTRSLPSFHLISAGHEPEGDYHTGILLTATVVLEGYDCQDEDAEEGVEEVGDSALARSAGGPVSGNLLLCARIAAVSWQVFSPAYELSVRMCLLVPT